MSRLFACILILFSAAAGATERLEAVQRVLPQLDQTFSTLADKEHIPGIVWGVVLDGKLVHVRSQGVANIETKVPVSAQTAFRIASMSKSFAALAILRLRDEGKLQLDDPVSRYLPELSAVGAPKDAPTLTLRHLLTMTPGLPEDNPWGDRHMRMTRSELAELVGRGLSFSSTPGGPYEYSNLGYIMLGQIICKVSGQPFQDYIRQHIFRPLGMHSTVWEYSELPAGRFAQGYQWLNGAWVAEPVLHDGEGAAMGGIITTLDDFARYVAFLMDAWPAREAPDNGPVKRSSVRELAEPRAFISMNTRATLGEGQADPRVAFYGYGLNWMRNSRDVVMVGHGGGLPGYGSQYRFSPERGVAVIAFGNLRYAPVYQPVTNEAFNLVERAHLPARVPAPAAILLQRQQEVVSLLQGWDESFAAKVVAMNFFLDRARSDWAAQSAAALARIGTIHKIGPIQPENALRGTFIIEGERGRLEVFFTLTPEREARLQELRLRVL
ncbi:serine hydrolase [Massilia sp. TS11]|uniref:serine hydrolase domain-containing protein n=1 Tax=Massilia sp. TS11 TaxID=2908003 RepID=UPI001EDA0B58|nr:serine hydrolase domain-containing protein [Massilia sp. TS11]MCG2584573.1 beta-lactamase family protein [Massilia sp. TS11]